MNARLAGGAYLILGIGLLALLLAEVGVASVLDHLGQLGLLGFGAVVLVYALAFALDSVSWLLTLTRLPLTGAWAWRTFCVRLAGEAFNTVVPAAGFGGEPVKALLLKRHYGIDIHRASASLVLARTINMLALLVFLAAGMGLLVASPYLDAELRWAAAAGFLALTLGTVAFLALQRGSALSRSVARLLRHRALGWLAPALAHAQAVDEHFAAFYARSHGRVSAALLLAIGNWLLGVVEIYLVLSLLGQPLTWTDAFIIEAATQMIRSAVFFIPGALGAQEGVFVYLVGAIAGDPGLGLAVAFARRARELVWVALGLACALVYRSGLVRRWSAEGEP